MPTPVKFRSLSPLAGAIAVLLGGAGDGRAGIGAFERSQYPVFASGFEVS